MATTTVHRTGRIVKKAPLVLTPQAIAKVREIMATQDPLPAGPAHRRGGRRLLRIPVLDGLRKPERHDG